MDQGNLIFAVLKLNHIFNHIDLMLNERLIVGERIVLRLQVSPNFITEVELIMAKKTLILRRIMAT